MNKTLQQLVRPNIWGLKPYSSARDEYKGFDAKVFLDANENPYNAPYNRYPDPLQTEVKRLLAPLKGVDEERIFLGNGSDEAIDLVFRVFCEPGMDNVVSLAPTYGMYPWAWRPTAPSASVPRPCWRRWTSGRKLSSSVRQTTLPGSVCPARR